MEIAISGIDVHILGRNFFPKHGQDIEDHCVYIVFSFFDCWDFPAASTLEKVKEVMQIL